MIKLDGLAKRTYTFPTDPAIALSYFSNLNRIAQFLPHISVEEEFGPNKLRMVYQSIELGAYTITIVTDIESRVDEASFTIHTVPLDPDLYDEVWEEATLNTTLGQGQFSSTAVFSPLDDGQTHIDYQLAMTANLPRPRGLRMMPGRVINRIVNSISQGRINEIADGFMTSAIEAFPAWLAKQPTN